MHPHARRLLLIWATLMVAAAGCQKLERKSSSEAPATEAKPGPMAAKPPAKESAMGTRAASGEAEPAEPAAMPRKIIRKGELRLVVKAWEPARKTITDLVGQAGGFVASSEVRHSLGQVSSATLVLRIPSGRFDGLVRRILELGVVQSQSLGSEDITEQYVDLRARLDNARKLEARLLQILTQKAAKLADVLAVEKELARVRETIERFQGKLRLLDNLVQLSTLTVHLSIQRKYTPPKPPTLGGDIAEVLGDSWDALQGFGRGLVLFLVALLPWVLPLVLVGWLLLRGWRRWRRRRAERRAGVDQAGR